MICAAAAHAMSVSSACRTSSAGRASTVRAVVAEQDEVDLVAGRASCRAAAPARRASRSTRTGCGSSASTTGFGSRPLSRSAASRPSATASPCGSSNPAAASSACANVWPRLSHARGPRSCGSRRQSAALYAAAPRTSSVRPASSSVLTSSATPWRRSRSGSVSSSELVDHDPGRPVERARRGSCPRAGRSPSCRRSRHRPGRRASSGPPPTGRRADRSLRRSPRRRSARRRRARRRCPSRSRSSSDQSRATTPSCLACSPDGSSCRETSRSPSAVCAAAPWIPITVASATSATGPSPGTSSPSRSSAPRSWCTPAAASTTPSDVAARDDRVRGRPVERIPLRVEAAKLLLVLRERARAADPPPRRRRARRRAGR